MAWLIFTVRAWLFHLLLVLLHGMLMQRNVLRFAARWYFILSKQMMLPHCLFPGLSFLKLTTLMVGTLINLVLIICAWHRILQIFIKIGVQLFNSPAYGSVFDFVWVIEAAEASWGNSRLFLRMSYKRILWTSTHFKLILNILSYARMNKLTTMKFLIDLEWLTLWWNWVIRAIWTSKYLTFLELLRRRATDKRSIGRDAAHLSRCIRAARWAEEGIFVGWALITTSFFTWTDKCILSRWRWLLWNWGVVWICLSKMVLDYHVGRDVYFRLRVAVYLCSVAPASALVLVACTSCGVFRSNLLMGLLVTMCYYLLVSLLIIGFCR